LRRYSKAMTYLKEHATEGLDISIMTPEVGPGRYCLTSHRMPFDLTDEGSKCVS